MLLSINGGEGLDNSNMIKHLPEPDWQPLTSAAVRTLPQTTQRWLCTTESMTKQLEALGNHFNFTLLQNAWNRPTHEESLQLKSEDDVMTREIMLGQRQKMWLYGRTLFPQKTWQQENETLMKFTHQPMGRLLFIHPNCQRLQLDYALLDNSHALFHYACAHFSTLATTLWARRSLFILHDSRLLLYEVFSSTLMEHDD